METIESKVYLILGDDLLLNGGFETPGAGGADIWADWTESVGDGALANETTIIHEGADAAKITAGVTANTTIYQAFTVIAGKKYRFRTITRGDGTYGGRYAFYDNTNSVYIGANRRDTDVSGTTYTLITDTFVTPALCVEVILLLVCPVTDGGIAYFDACEVHEWAQNLDVLLDPPLTWEYGLRGDSPTDLLASTGIATFHLDNFYSNSAGKPGLYSPGHTDVLTGFGEGTEVEITVHNGAAEIVKFIGTIAGIRPSSGLFEYPYVEVEAHDWIGYLTGEDVGIIALQEKKRADEALTTALVNFPHQPTATDFETGLETFLLMFNNTTPGMSMARLFQGICNNELARIYLEGDGTLRLENRNTRAEVTTPAFTLPGLMTEIDPSYERRDIYNIINVIINPIEASPNADVLLWDEKVAEYFDGVIPSILPGESIVLKCPFTDPALGVGISAMDVVDPITVIEFGSAPDYESNDMIDDLGQSQSIGANASIVTLTNNHASKTGYLNDLQIYGRALYHYRTQILTAEDSDSINAGTGEKRFSFRPDQITETEKAQAYAHYILGMVGTGRMKSVRVRVLANQSNALRVGLIAAEVSTLFSVAESVTGVDYDFYVNRIRYSQDSEALWVDLFAGSADRYNCFVWDRSHWDSEFDARWAI